MFSRYIIFSLGIISILWISFVGFDIINKQNQFAPASIFDYKDQRVLVINRLYENPFSKSQFPTTASNQKYITALSPWLGKENTLLISEKQNKISIKNQEGWTINNVKSLFKKAKLPFTFTKFKHFTSGPYQGIFNQETLILTNQKMNKNKPTFNWEIYDKNASSALITLHKNNFTISDIYLNQKNKYEYVTKYSRINSDQQIRDQELFSIALPNTLENYHFQEKKYAGLVDPVIKKNSLYEWMETGYVTFTYNGQQVIISDYISNLNPILVLNEKIQSDENQEESGHYTNIKLTSDFPKNKQTGFHAKVMDDFVVLAESKDICDQVIADYRIGNTLALKKVKLNQIFTDLPQKVSERYVSKTEKYSKTSYKNKLFETHLFLEKSKQNDKLEKSSFSTPIGLEIENLILFEEIGNMIAISKNGSLTGFRNSKKSWHKELKGYPFHEISEVTIDQSTYYLITTTKEIHLIDKSGNEPKGFPISLASETTTNASFFSHKNSKYLAVTNEKNEIVLFNLKGKQYQKIATKLTTIRQPIDSWISNKKLYIGAKDDFNYFMYNFDKKREHRRFSVAKNTYSLALENELINYSFDGNEFIQIDQKGNKKQIKTIPGGKIIGIEHREESPVIVVKAGNEIICFNSTGEIVTRTMYDFGQLDFVSTYQDEQLGLITLVVDGINNTVFAYSGNDKITEQNLDGKALAYIKSRNSKYIITTIINEYAVQYLIK